MVNVIYMRTLAPRSESPDGETPTLVYVTEECNGFLIFYSSHQDGQLALRWFADRDRAIEFAVKAATATFETLAELVSMTERKAEARA